MHPVLFALGSFQLFSWGAMLAVSLSLGLLAVHGSARLRGYDSERMTTAVLLLVMAGVVGARLAYIAMNTGEFAGSGIMGVLDLRTGGMAFHGALIAGMAVLPLLARYVGTSTVRLADAISPGLALGYGVQRVGCFLNGDSFGTLTDVPWAVMTRFAPGLRHPVQLYDSVMSVGLFLILAHLFRNKAKDGRVLAVYLAGSGLARFISEFHRDGSRLVAWVTPAQVVSVGLVVFALVLLAMAARKPATTNEKTARL